eukprot:365417-Chlamydomonas_euryale.AAC.6
MCAVAARQYISVQACGTPFMDSASQAAICQWKFKPQAVCVQQQAAGGVATVQLVEMPAGRSMPQMSQHKVGCCAAHTFVNSRSTMWRSTACMLRQRGERQSQEWPEAGRVERGYTLRCASYAAACLVGQSRHHHQVPCSLLHASEPYPHQTFMHSVYLTACTRQGSRSRIFNFNRLLYYTSGSHAATARLDSRMCACKASIGSSSIHGYACIVAGGPDATLVGTTPWAGATTWALSCHATQPAYGAAWDLSRHHGGCGTSSRPQPDARLFEDVLPDFGVLWERLDDLVAHVHSVDKALRLEVVEGKLVADLRSGGLGVISTCLLPGIACAFAWATYPHVLPPAPPTAAPTACPHSIPPRPALSPALTTGARAFPPAPSTTHAHEVPAGITCADDWS